MNKFRFSLTTFLLAIPSWILAFLLCPFVPSVHLYSSQWNHDAAKNQVDLIRDWASRQLAANPSIEFDDYDVSDLMSEHHADSSMRDGRQLWNDPWGREYVTIEKRMVGSDGSHCTFHVYSCGMDGKSQSNGNDADDINSWNYDPKDYYAGMEYWHAASTKWWHTLWLTPMILTGLVSVARFVQIVYANGW